MKNFLIGIGGTGAKCIEHLVHSCSAGLGPDQVWVGMVDQDEANGNVNKTKILLSKYQNLRNSLREEGRNDLSAASNLFKTNITTNNDSVWLPLKGADPSLEEVVKYNALKPEVKGLLDCLYDPQERQMNLSEGFRGRPNIGAAAMLATAANENDPFWSQIHKAIDAAKGGEEVRIFIIGSIFGGTGASGFPNIARKIRAIQAEKGVTSNVYIGGALMLPYFDYDVPEEMEEGTIYAKPNQFLDQTKAALEYYSKLFEYNKIFDQVYVTGWDPLTKLPKFEIGGNTQFNSPLFPETYAALGALKFFNKDNEISSEQQIFHIGKNESNDVFWSDVPNISSDLNSKDRIINLIRFAFSYNWMYGPALTGTWSKIKKYSDEHWFKKLISTYTYDDDLKSSNIGRERNQEIVKLVQEYCQDVLTWITDMNHATTANSDQRMDLVLTDFFSKYDPKNNSNKVTLNEKLSSNEKKDFKDLIHNDGNLTLANIMSNISYIKTNKDQKGLGVFMDTLFRSCGK